MTIQIENQVHEWNSETAGIFVKPCNLLTFADNRKEQESALSNTPFKEDFKKNFLWGYGARHFWVVQRCPCNGDLSGKRLMIVEFNEREL